MQHRTRQRAITIKFCVTGKSGLGHLRRVSNIASKIKTLSPDVAIILLTNAPIAGLAEQEKRAFAAVHIALRAEMAQTLVRLAPGPVVIDTAIIEGAGLLADPLCLILRETVDDKLPSFRLGYGRKWNAVIIPSPALHWTVAPETIGVDRIDYVGWIYRPTKPTVTRVLPPPDDRPTLLIATGGGGNSETASRLAAEINGVVACLRQRVSVRVIQAVGPRMPLEGLISGADLQVDAGSRLNEAFAEADAVVSTVGYNSVLELAGLATPALLVPIARALDDQGARADVWAERLGLAHRTGHAERSASWLAAVLSGRIRRERVDLGTEGDLNAARVILDVARRSAPVPQAWAFEKPIKLMDQAQAAANASHELFAAGAPTLPVRYDHQREVVAMARVAGIDGREMLSARGATAELDGLLGLMDIVGPCISQLSRFHRASMRISREGLLPLDALVKVRSRLIGASGEEFLALARPLAAYIARRLVAHLSEGSGPNVVVHGDFHVGQVLFPENSREPLIIDLEDMAVGPAEFDLANFAAHVVTCPAIYRGPVLGGFHALVSLLTAHYGAGVDGHPLNQDLVRTFGAGAILRRCLKLAEQLRKAQLAAELLCAAVSLAGGDAIWSRGREGPLRGGSVVPDRAAALDHRFH